MRRPGTDQPGWTLVWRWGLLCLWVATVSGFSTGVFSAALAACALAAVCGTADELQQLFVPSRTASVMDVGWDGLGAVLGVTGWGTLSRLPAGEEQRPPRRILTRGQCGAPAGD